MINIALEMLFGSILQKLLGLLSLLKLTEWALFILQASQPRYLGLTQLMYHQHLNLLVIQLRDFAVEAQGKSKIFVSSLPTQSTYAKPGSE